MKVTKWWKKLSAAVVAAGIWVPGAYAIDVPLGDPSFEAYVVPAIGYAYSNEYRPTSAWVDDLDSPPGYTQDDGSSSWLYDATYAENATFSRRASPRTGNQALHGLANYNAQETNAVFEAGKLYTFSIWAQNDEKLDNSNGLYMYIFDGTVPFSDANALSSQLFTTEIPARAAGMSDAESQANWVKLSIEHLVAAGAPEIGHPVGVGFFARRDTAVDDASLDCIPEPATLILVGMSGLSILGLRRRG